MSGSGISQEPFRTTVTSIRDGVKGRYVVTVGEGQGSVTFALTEDTWNHDEPPEIGEVVNVYDVFTVRGGRRAKRACRIKAA